MNLRRLIPFFDHSVSTWSVEARLLRWLTLTWLFVGLVMLFSASYPVADANHNDGLYYFKRQVLWVFAALIIFNIITNLPLRKVLGVTHWFLLFFLILIFATLSPLLGKTVLGSARWIAL
ncbi:MAG TPA: FtsW/RodA/SpoVE family cell cycle protein, partial [Nostocaceae cyanobacterium]|nr:FtsW/RodA/SpoVE family cell cycle protein [Nostocaceae cyanobacterium]